MNCYCVIAKNSQNKLLLIVSDSDCFDKENRQSDFTPNCTNRELEKLGFETIEIDNGILSFRDEPKLKDLQKKLQKSTFFSINKGFEDFVKQFDCDEHKVIPFAKPLSKITKRNCLKFLAQTSKDKWQQILVEHENNDVIRTFVAQNDDKSIKLIKISEREVRKFLKEK